MAHPCTTSNSISTSITGGDDANGPISTKAALSNSSLSNATVWTPSVISNIKHNTTFFKELVTPYVDMAPSSTLQAPSQSLDTDRVHIPVDWHDRPSHTSYSDEAERRKLGLPEDFDPRNLFQPIYKPFGKWSWIDGFPINESSGQILLSSGAMCSAYIKSGKINDREIAYVSKTWLTQEAWDGFYTELALYKVQLKPLQGDVVPTIINVYSSPGKVNVAMEPPHHSFWIEASADMPHVLKKRCVEAFEKIHARGVLHGDVELRHMLIGGDGKVTIIDFQNGRALVPNDAVNLKAATPADLRMELRKVKFKLDYEGSRNWEDEKQVRCAQRAKKSQEALYQIQNADSEPEDDTMQDIVDPVVDSQVWNLEWLQPWNPCPMRYTMPGQTSAGLEREIRHFLSVIERMEQEESLAEGSITHSKLPPTPPPPPDRRRNSAAAAFGPSEERKLHPRSRKAEARPSAEVDSRRYSLRKRNTSSVSSGRPEKRIRLNPDLSVPPRSNDKPRSTENARRKGRNPFSKAHPPTSISSKRGRGKTVATCGVTPLPVNDGRIRFPYPAKAALEVPPLSMRALGEPSKTTQRPAKSRPAKSAFPPVKVRDFAYEPPVSSRALNVQRHHKLGLSRPETMPLNLQDACWQKDGARNRQRLETELLKKLERDQSSWKFGKHWVNIGMRSSNHARKATVGPRTAEERTRAEGDLLANRRQAKRMRDNSDDLDRYMASDGISDIRKQPKVLKISGFETAANATLGFLDMLMTPVQSIVQYVANVTLGGITDGKATLQDGPMFDDENGRDMSLDAKEAVDTIPLAHAKPSSKTPRLVSGTSFGKHTTTDTSVSDFRPDSGRKRSCRRSSRIRAMRGIVPRRRQSSSVSSEEEVEVMLRSSNDLHSAPSLLLPIIDVDEWNN